MSVASEGAPVIIAIDGPAGAGKSTISRRLAERLGLVRLDTGAIYRVVALAATGAGRGPDDPGLGAFVEGLGIAFVGDRVHLDGRDVTAEIRTPAVSSAASRYAKVPAVRAALLGLQRRLGRARGAVVDGRDIGTVVFPDAEVKIFLTAAAEVRAARRVAQLAEQGIAADLEQVLADIRARDRQDTERAIAPLRRADDAVVVDNDAQLGLDGAVQACVDVVRAAGFSEQPPQK